MTTRRKFKNISFGRKPTTGKFQAFIVAGDQKNNEGENDSEGDKDPDHNHSQEDGKQAFSKNNLGRNIASGSAQRSSMHEEQNKAIGEVEEGSTKDKKGHKNPVRNIDQDGGPKIGIVVGTTSSAGIDGQTFFENANKGSWSSLFEFKPTRKSSFPSIDITSDPEKGVFSISIPNSLVDHTVATMKNKLVGKFIGPRPNIDVVRLFIARKWKLKGQVDIAALPKGFFTLFFSSAEDLSDVLCGGLWMIGKLSLSLQKWGTRVDLNAEMFEATLVWVHFQVLPLEYWYEDVCAGMDGSFGELLSIDPMTAARSRQVYARICVNINQKVDLPMVITINSKLGKHIQMVDFESLPFACFTCKKSGYWAKQCPLKPKEKLKKNEPRTEWREKNGTVEIQSKSNIPTEEKKTNEELTNGEEKKDQAKEGYLQSQTFVDKDEETVPIYPLSPLKGEIPKDDNQSHFSPPEDFILMESPRPSKVGKEVNDNTSANQGLGETKVGNSDLVIFQISGQDNTPALGSISRSQLEVSEEDKHIISPSLALQESPWSEVVDKNKVKKLSKQGLIQRNSKSCKKSENTPQGGIQTRSKHKADVGSSSGGRAKPTHKKTREQEAKKNIVNGKQSTIPEICSPTV